MSWEIMRTETAPCECGEGTETFTFEMDDWNRTQSSTEIHCPKCQQKKQREIEVEQAREKKRDELLQRAQQLTTERYLLQWLALFAGMTKKAAWERYTGGSGYPALGTFYLHVKHSGSLGKYMEWCLTNDLERSLGVLEVKDKEIDALLQERAQLWRPSSVPL
ncbi:hypothetical protein [Edaphobacter aggregans]|uniref:hypothetical protein n=1 Tax=Edaphobacter aggregans TaxID=570835 RepID=UPI0012F91828|nr:hypothetical protein [Edaphobacter aggregans]